MAIINWFEVKPSPLYENNHYHEECLRCNSCGLNLTGPNQKRARRFKNQILCDLHFADVALMECSDFMQQLRSFKPQSLGCAVARRKSSTTLIFPLPPQACSACSLVQITTPTPTQFGTCSTFDELFEKRRDASGRACEIALPEMQSLELAPKGVPRVEWPLIADAVPAMMKCFQ
uniref:LIM zinc-binding domain-containing protein n=1 Tax=Anopheles farauti TaxID=69004 RepID=A0A182QIS1_9DIPT